MGNIRPILKTFKKFYKKIDELDKYLFSDDFMCWYITEMSENILDYYGIPKDNTTELLNDRGETDWENEKTFCRDYYNDYLFDYLNGKINLTKFETLILKAKRDLNK